MSNTFLIMSLTLSQMFSSNSLAFIKKRLFSFIRFGFIISSNLVSSFLEALCTWA